MISNKHNKLFLSKLKNYEKEAPNWKEYLDEEYIEGNDAIVKLNIPSDYEITSPFSLGKQLTLNSEIYDYIDEKIYPIPTYIPVTLSISGIKKEQQAETKKLIQEHYYTSFMDKKIDMKINAIRAISLFVCGVILMSIYFILNSLNVGELFDEIISVAASFLLWEAVDFSILERNALRREYLYSGQLALLNITFIEENS